MKPSKELRQSIILEIAQKERQSAKIYLILSLHIFVISVIGIISSAQYLLQSFYQSGFYQYLSLLPSEGSVITSYWKELAYSLVETLPIVGIVVFLVAVGFFVWSGVYTITKVRRFILLPN